MYSVSSFVVACTSYNVHILVQSHNIIQIESAYICTPFFDVHIIRERFSRRQRTEQGEEKRNEKNFYFAKFLGASFARLLLYSDHF